MSNYVLKNNEEVRQMYQSVKAKYEKLKKEKDELELAVNNLKIKRAALTFERDKFPVYHKDIIGELNEEIIKLEKEIDSKEGLLKYVSIRIEVYYYTMKEEVESKIKRYSSED